MTNFKNSIRTAALAAALFLPLMAPVQADVSELPAGKYEMDLAHSSIVWGVSHFGLSLYKARFANFETDLYFDPQNPEKSKMSVTVDPKSVKTQFPYVAKEDFDATLVNSKQWFNADAHPEIKFVSTDIDIKDDETGIVKGDLTFLGVTKPIEMEVTLRGFSEKHPFAGVPAVGFSGRTSFKRSDFGMTAYVPNIGDEVVLEIETEFLKAK